MAGVQGGREHWFSSSRCRGAQQRGDEGAGEDQMAPEAASGRHPGANTHWHSPGHTPTGAHVFSPILAHHGTRPTSAQPCSPGRGKARIPRESSLFVGSMARAQLAEGGKAVEAFMRHLLCASCSHTSNRGISSRLRDLSGLIHRFNLGILPPKI